jgi:glutaconate CoA-transferase subunit B
MFQYWLQGGRITVGFLGGAQIDRFGNLNTTVIGDYAHPKVRLPGSGGATEIATSCRRTYIVMKQSRRTFVDTLDFLTSLGHGPNGTERRKLGVQTSGPALLVSDLCVMKPHEATNEFEVVSLHPGINRDQVQAETGWPIRFAAHVTETAPPTGAELETLRDLHARTARAHGTAPGDF